MRCCLKSEDSIIRKYEKTLRTGGGFKQCFNDMLGFRLRFDDYPGEYPDYFRVVDLRRGKKIDDGYRAIHLYYQRDNLSYPMEVQLWCGKDFSVNIWSHQYVYKYKTPEIGKLLYREYSTGMIRTEKDFLARLQELESCKTCQELSRPKSRKISKNTPPKIGAAKQTVVFWRP